ncbi:phytoene desaturase family protein [Paenibacillus filicis]|uniref:4,4'-diaponeurosporene oxygenase n=1 Tax=Paenibacillus gyeongsangnamensis TaxID=3388067 RepID=A0ABT4QG74_9BACL|nr:phytoene desaturase family protein [Paenibacillus filicis]MCZ8515852.1 phytoene desaturase family protein [Paenibacillus filicis]
MTTRKQGIVIGGGIGGLVTSILLSVQGFDMTLLEQNERLGGKLQPVALGKYQFDFGPSAITMPWIFEQVFREAGEAQDPELQFLKLAVNSRNVFEDGSSIDLSSDPLRMEEQLAHFPRQDRLGFHRYLLEVERLFNVVQEQFFSRTFTEWTDFVSPKLGSAIASAHPFETMDHFHRRYFQDSRLMAMMNRYATYAGSSPYETPAALSMIAYLELVRGVYYISGGSYRLVEALERLARKVGVRIHTGVRTEQICVRSGRACGVIAGGDKLEADFVVSNADVFTTQSLLKPGERSVSSINKHPVRLSSSGFLMLFGMNRPIRGLQHHNVYYPGDYGAEFQDMFHRRRWPEKPAIYVSCSSVTEPERGGYGGSNLYVLIQVPPEKPAYDASRPYEPGPSEEDARLERMHSAREQIIQRLGEIWEIPDWQNAVEEEAMFGTDYIASRTGAYAGAMYGSASHGWRPTFCRPPQSDRTILGLYYAGGTTHPGGGTPMAAMSGMNAARIISRHHGKD